jgi:glycosyltransferase involved in cell wall biosynthesis
VYYGDRIGKTIISTRLAATMGKVLGRTSVVHLTGLFDWIFPWTVMLCMGSGVPLVLSVRGSLLESARRWRSHRKTGWQLLVGSWALGRVSVFHATSQEEADAVNAMLPGASIVVIPNGVGIPDTCSARPKASPAQDGLPYIAYLGRIHPFKQVERIIHAFGVVTRRRPARLVVAGTGEEAYLVALRRIALEQGLGEQVCFIGHVSGAEKEGLLTAAQGLVLASKSESFGMSVAEALAHGTPCVVTKTAPWSGLERERCGFWVDDCVEALAEGMRKLIDLSPEERRAMGERGRAWMARDFSWGSVAKRMIGLYERVMDESRARQRSNVM